MREGVFTLLTRRMRAIGLSLAGIAALGLAGQPAVVSASPKPTSQKIEHVIYIITDNVHLADIQQMPHLMKFLHQGTLFNNDHTILDSHTQDGMVSDMTGKYPDKTGVVDQSFYAAGKYSSFLYWTSPDSDGQPHVTTTPPWQTFNQKGWNVGAIGAPDAELESASEVKTMNAAVDTTAKDYLGVAVHYKDGSHVFGSPNLDYIYNATAWTDSSKKLGAFPGWGAADPNWPLQATYQMQTHGVPVTFTYLHDVHEVNGTQKPPGQYDSTVQMYDQAFQTFFTKLNQAGINASNTLFVLTTDEGDQYVPGGEHNTNLQQWITQASGVPSTDMNIVSDSGALVYLKNQSVLPHVLSSFAGIPGWNYLADPTELRTLHMNMNQSPSRTPSFAVFANPDVWYNTSGNTDWTAGAPYMYNHGTISQDILQTWLGMVGPGVKQANVSTQWLDHADTMPTIYALLGYPLQGQAFDGVPALDAFAPAALPASIRASQAAYRQSENVFKQLNAPVGAFGLATLKLSTTAAVEAENSKGPALDTQIAGLTNVRDTVAAHLQTQLLSLWSANKKLPIRDAGNNEKTLKQLMASVSALSK